MVSYGELIYNFADIYLKSAMECSICKENYTMVNDEEFLDEYMKVFVSLLSAVEQDDTLSIEHIKKTLEKRKDEKIKEFQFFMRHKIVEQALEKVQEDLKHGHSMDNVDHAYVDEICDFLQEVFDEKSTAVAGEPAELLRYIRSKEELLFRKEKCDECCE
jgi:hypothetical protein